MMALCIDLLKVTVPSHRGKAMIAAECCIFQIFLETILQFWNREMQVHL